MTSLTLTRKEFQSVVLFTKGDEQIVVTVESIGGSQVKLNFVAPKSVEIWRDELLELVPE